MEKIFLPGGDSQLKFMLGKVDVSRKNILFIGANHYSLAVEVLKRNPSRIEIIVNDGEALIGSGFTASKDEGIRLRMMDFERTDFNSSEFDIIYVQCGFPSKRRNKIIKEATRILKNSGILCVGEIVSLTKNPPSFIESIWNNSGMAPIFKNNFNDYYESKNFTLIDSIDLSAQLNEFYSLMNSYIANLANISKEEQKNKKKLISAAKHESETYLKMGGRNHIGMLASIFMKVKE